MTTQDLKARAAHGEYSLHNFPDDPDADHSVWSIFHTTESGGLEVASGMDRATADLLLAALAPAPVEASGSERDTALSILQAAVRSFDNGDTTNLSAVLDDILDALRPQPSGETREGPTKAEILGVVRQYCAPAWCSVDRLTDALHALFARPAPAASGGQHSTATDFPPDDVLACEEDTTPARAEAQDEGAAGETEALALDQLANAAEVVRRLLHKTKEVQGPAFREAGISFTTAIDHARALLRQRDAHLAHPSPPPAADEDRVRKAAIVAKNMADNASFNLNQAGLTQETATCDRAFLDIYHTLDAALKSEGK